MNNAKERHTGYSYDVRFLIIWSVLLVFTACTTAPSMVSYFIETGIIQYFLPSTDWAAQGSGAKAPAAQAKAKVDITCRTGTDAPAVVNISFFGKRSIPRKITSITLNGSSAVCPLENIVVLYPNPEKRELRITTEGDRNTFAAALETEPITLTAEIDGVLYTYTPNKKFIKLKNDFLMAISYF